ncbi:MAG: hypothetical protein ACKVQB_11030 [Bacteroidia bacterium]
MFIPVNDIYDCYAFICKVDKEEDRLYYWPQWEIFYTLLTPLINDWEFKKVEFEQSFEVLLKSPKGGPYRTTAKNAPTGGKRNWTYENNKDISTRHLLNNAHLIYIFNNFGKPFDYAELFPKDKSGLIQMQWGWIQAAKEPRKNVNTVMDLYIKLGNLNRLQIDSYNQYLSVFVKRGIFETNVLTEFLKQAYDLTFAEKLYHNWRPFRIIWKDKHGSPCFNNVTDDYFMVHKSEAPNTAKNKWTEIYFK